MSASQLSLDELLPSRIEAVESREATLDELQWRVTVPPDRDLMYQIKSVGKILSPVLVSKSGPLFPEDTKLIVFEGNRRCEAAKRLGMTSVPVRIFETDAALAHLTIMLNETRSSNDLMELDAIMELSRLGASETTIAQATGMSVGTIRKRLRLRKLTPGLRHAVEQGRISIAVGIAAAKRPETEQIRLVAILLDQGKLTLRDVAEIRRAKKDEAVATLPADMFASWGLDAPVQRDPADDTIHKIASTLVDLEGGFCDEGEALTMIRKYVDRFIV